MFERKLEIVGETDVGKSRRHNEDAIDENQRIGLAVLADGMGGVNAGEVASSMCVHFIMDELSAYQNGSALIEAELCETDDGLPIQVRILRHAVEKANNAVFHVSRSQPQCEGMGTTVVVSLFYNDKIAVGHIGDSRLYRFRNDKLEQITKDHSFVQELIDQGSYTKEEARNSRRKNVVTRALGVAPTVDVDVQEHAVESGDIYLMCSDGLSDLVRDGDIESSLREQGKDLKKTARHLVAVANASGGSDNISVILAKVNRPFSGRDGFFQRIFDWFE